MMKLTRDRMKGSFVCALAAISLSFLGPAQADEWPEDNIRLVVPYSAGGTTDLLSRKVADMLQKELGTVIVENRPGAGSTVATGQLARGGRGSDHMLLMASPGHTIALSKPSLRPVRRLCVCTQYY